MYCFNKPKLSGCYKLCLGFLFLFFGQFHHRLAFDKWTLAHQPSGPTGPKGGGGGVGGGGRGWSLVSKKDNHFDLSSLQLVVSKLKWFTFFIAAYQDKGPCIYSCWKKGCKSGAIFSHILRYKKGKLEPNK